MAITLASLGYAYGYLGDAPKHRDLLERALKIKEAYFGEDHHEVVITLMNLGIAYGNLGNIAKERDLLERALKMFEAHWGEDHHEVAITLMSLGMSSRHLLEGYEVARESCERALRIFRKTWGPEHRYPVQLQSHIQDVLQKNKAPAYSHSGCTSESFLECYWLFSFSSFCSFLFRYCFVPKACLAG